MTTDPSAGSPAVRELAKLVAGPTELAESVAAILGAAITANPGLVLQAMREMGVLDKAEDAELRKLRRAVAAAVEHFADPQWSARDCVSDLADALGREP